MNIQPSKSLLLLIAACVLTAGGRAEEADVAASPKAVSDDLKGYWSEVVMLYDSNADGQLDKWERLILQRDLESGFLKAPSVTRSREQARAHRREILAMYDANGDGRLDQWERMVLDRDIDAGDILPPGRTVQVVASGG